MRKLKNLILFFTFSTPFVLCAQGYAPFLDLLALELPKAEMEQKIDSFFRVNDTMLTRRELAECYHDRAGRWHYEQYQNTKDPSELDKAILFTQKALKIKRNLVDEEMCAINRTLFNLGYFHHETGLSDKALTFYQEVIRKGAAYCGDNSSEFLIDFASRNAARINLEKGEYHMAINLLEQMIARNQNETDNNDDAPFWGNYMMAEVLMAMDLFTNSEQIAFYLSRAQKFIDEKGIPCCFYQNLIDQLEGNRLSEIGNYQLSIQRHQRVVENLDSKKDSVDLAFAHNSLGKAYFDRGDNNLAVQHYSRALKYNPNYDSPHNNFGDLYLAQKLYPKALQSYQRAVDKAIDKQGNLTYELLPTLGQVGLAPDKAALLNHLIFKAKGWMAYYEAQKSPEKLEMALATIDLADHLVDIIRQESHEFQSKLFWREQGSELYGIATKLSYLLDNPERAYYFMERNKALLLLEDLTHEEAKDIAQLPQNIALREYKLKRSLFLTENELYEADGSIDAIDSLKTLLNDNKYVYQKFMDSLNTHFPDYAKFKKKVHILTLEELKAGYVSNEQLVLHYILNEDDGYGLLTGVDGSILFQLENPSQLSSKIDTLTTLLSSGISDFSTFKATSHTLFKTLIPEAVYNKIRGKRLIIIPDYTLQRIPFETLVVDKSETKYLMEDVEVSYVYSMSLLDHNLGDVRNHSKQLLSFAPVNFDSLNLAELSNSESEISGIVPFFEGDIFLNDKASKANFLKVVDDPKIIHLATHADIGNGENPWIAFSDEKMYLKEIYATKNQSEMVVLSACNTLSGDLKRGEGIMSLARGFFYSGAKCVVSSLWPLTDESGSDIMISFYQNLDRGHSKSKALRQAKLDYMNSNIVEELKHPFYWAGFVVVGDNAPLVTTRNPIWIYIGIVLALVVLYVFRHKLVKRL